MGDRVKAGQSYELLIPIDNGQIPPTSLDPTALTVTARTSAGTVAFTRTIGQLEHLGLGSYRLVISTGTGGMLVAADTYTLEVVADNPDIADATWLDVVPNVPAVLSMSKALKAIRRSGVRRADEDVIADYVDAVNDWVTWKVGPVLPTTVVEAVTPNARTGGLRLRTTPVLAVLSATYAGSAVDVSGWPAPSSYGRLTLTPGLYPAPASGAGLVVTYRAGRVPVPMNIPIGAEQLFEHLWEMRRARQPSGAPVPAGTEEITVAGVGYAVPNAVAELLAPYALDDLPGVA